jgi:hypothetical protein
MVHPFQVDIWPAGSKLAIPREQITSSAHSKCFLPKPALPATIVAFFGRSYLLSSLMLCVRGRCQLRRCRCIVDKRVSDQTSAEIAITWSDVNDNIASFDRTAVLQLQHQHYGDR